MKRILVPTDFSVEAENALKVAAQLAKKYNSEIYLLHMLELPLDLIDPMHNSSELPEAMFFMQLAHKKFEKVMNMTLVPNIILKFKHSASCEEVV